MNRLRRWSPFIKVGLLFASLFVFGFLRTYYWLYKSYRPYTALSFHARVVKPPQQKGAYQLLRLQPIDGGRTVLIRTWSYPKYSYGDLLEVKLIKPVKSTTSSINFPLVKRIGINRGNFLLRLLYRLREEILVRIDKILVEPYASLLAGIVFGIERDLGKSVTQTFRDAGLMHIVVASGFNVSMVFGFLGKFLRFLGRRLGFFLMVGGTLAYAVMAGFNPPIVRAAVMGLATLLAVSVGKRRQALLWLVFTAMIMLIWQPLLYRSLSFQLSFLATLAILLFQPHIEGYFYFFPRLIRSDLATTLSVQILVLPLVWWRLGLLQPVAILVNTLVLWTIELIMPLGMLAVATAFVNLFLASLVALPLWLMLSYLVWVVEIFT